MQKRDRIMHCTHAEMRTISFDYRFVDELEKCKNEIIKQIKNIESEPRFHCYLLSSEQRWGLFLQKAKWLGWVLNTEE
jgi:hypothetical protein